MVSCNQTRAKQGTSIFTSDMAQSSQKESSDFEDEGLLPILDMLNFKITKLDDGEIGFRDDNKRYITPQEKYYAGEYCRLNDQVQHWKSVCEANQFKVAELEENIQRLVNENDQLNKKAVNLKDVESIMEEQQMILEALEEKLKKVEKDFGNKLAEEKRVVELKENIIIVLENKLKGLQKENQDTGQQLKDLSDFLNECNISLEENIISFVNEFNLTCVDPETSDKALEKEDGNDNESVHLKLKRNLRKLSAVVRKTFTEILAMGNESNIKTAKFKDKTCDNDSRSNHQLRKCYDDEDQYNPVCSPVTPEQCNVSDL